jgi:succinate dehydrogenase/fumarate reductase flavoprotein subunit
VRRCRDFGRDLAREPVEVGPTAHFMMGGVVIDTTCCTAIEGLFAAGEDAGGVHGANRLGGNGVADSTVFGGIAGDVMAAFVAGRSAPQLQAAVLRETARAVRAPLGRPAGVDLYALQRQLRDAMWDGAGLVRDAAGLAHARDTVQLIAAQLADVGVAGGPVLNLAWQDWLNLSNQCATARLIITSALERRESRGAHWRADFPDPEPGQLYSVRVCREGDDVVVSRQPVVFSRLAPTSPTTEPAAVEIGD